MRNSVAKLDGVEKCSTGKLAIRFVGICSDDIVSWTTRSAFLFDTDADAIAAGERALMLLTSTGMFPNMCESF